MNPRAGRDAAHTAGSKAGWDAEGLRRDVQRCLDDFVDEQQERLEPMGPDAARLLAEARTAVTGGKRLRAAFCHWGFRAVDPGPPTGRIAAGLVRAGAALETLHASLLAHDDLIDGSEVRRGRPAAHRAFATEHASAGWRGGADAYGAAGAVLLGDLLQGWAEELLRTCGLGWDVVGPALAVYDRCRTEVITGQFLDVSVQARGRADVDAAMTVLRYKSAKYSIERPLHVGAALAGADAATLGRLSGFGLPLGEAFQLRDDLLGVFGDPEVTGKPAGDDLVEGKRTVLVALALDALGERDEAARLDAALGTALTPAEVDELRGLIEGTGAREQVEAAIGSLTSTALGALDAAGLDPATAQALRELAAAATQRTV